MLASLPEPFADLPGLLWSAIANFPSWVSTTLGELQGAIVSISALGVLITFVLGQRAAARDRQREEYAKALQAVVKWREMPYRIRRRNASDQTTMSRLVEAMHELQEEIAFH